MTPGEPPSGADPEIWYGYLPDPGRRWLSIPVRAGDVSSHTLFTTSWERAPARRQIADTLEEFGFVGTFYASTGPEGRRLISDNAFARIGRNHELGVQRRIPTVTSFLDLARESELRDRSRRLLPATARHHQYVHTGGHAADPKRLDQGKALRGLLGMAADPWLVGVSNSEAFDRLSRKRVTEA
jgi:hypothetical protein